MTEKRELVVDDPASRGVARRRRIDDVDALAIAVAHALASCIVLATGFDHVSDDDFARVTIAEAFAHAPHLDPSGTSWLPFPFWWLGTAMAIFGRSLGVARVASIVLASAAASLPYLAIRSVGVSRARALGAAALALLSPWSLWLGAATVPESFTASAASAAIIVLAHRRSYAFAALLALACLSRYEAWPVAAVTAVCLLLRARRDRAFLGVAALAAAAPLLWMVWNAATHGSPFHFFHRVSTFKRAIGAGSTSTLDALLLYPRLFFTTRPEVAVATLAGLASLRDGAMRKRWFVPLLAIFGQLVFLAVGNARDGAAAHHPERALHGVFVLASLFAVDACATLFATRNAQWPALAFVFGWIWSFTNAYAGGVPGTSPFEDRRPQIARGLDLRARDVKSFTVEPCAFEHFALLAAYGAPENANVLPKTDATVGPECPRVTE